MEHYYIIKITFQLVLIKLLNNIMDKYCIGHVLYYNLSTYISIADQSLAILLCISLLDL